MFISYAKTHYLVMGEKKIGQELRHPLHFFTLFQSKIFYFILNLIIELQLVKDEIFYNLMLCTAGGNQGGTI